MKFALVITALLVLVSPLKAQEQRDFSSDDGIKDIEHPVSLPESVMKLLSDDLEISEVLSRESPGSKTLPSEWVRAAMVHLADSKETDYVVLGIGPLMGAHSVQFRVVRMLPHGPVMVLRGFGDQLSVGELRHKALRDITVTYYTGAKLWPTQFRFNGSTYVAQKK